FFSSRRRHTRCLSDWSSDVCSSDLSSPAPGPSKGGGLGQSMGTVEVEVNPVTSPGKLGMLNGAGESEWPKKRRQSGVVDIDVGQIGRASCRGGGESTGEYVSWTAA